jgi:alkylation response protein AidB-like acyl-CoA dehydrogenase
MDFLPDADQQALVDATRDFVASRFPLRGCPTQPDDVHWKEIAALGWLGLAADEEAGGAGASVVDEALVFREIGRGLVPGPILSTLAAARLASWAGAPSLATELIEGRRRAARAVPTGPDGGLLVTDPSGSALVLVIGEHAAALHALPEDVELSPGIEDTTVIGRIGIGDLPVPLVSSDDVDTVGRLRRLLAILTSAHLAGIAGATRDLATTHATERIQFAKPIGAFQAIKHKCADMATQALAADNVMFFAALTEATTPTGSDYHTLAAATFCRRAAFANARTNVQIHGAMGFTVEDSAHRFVKRTHALCAAEGFSDAARRLGALPNPDVSEEM